MSDGQFYSEIESQLPCEALFGRIVRSPQKSGILRSVSVQPDGAPPGDTQIFLLGEIFGGETRLCYEGEPAALAVGPDRRRLAELSFRFDVDGGAENEPPAPKKKSRTNVTAEREAEFDTLFETAAALTQETWVSEISPFSCKETEGAVAHISDGNVTVFTPLADTRKAAETIGRATRLAPRNISFVSTVPHGKNSNAERYCELSAVLAAFAAVRTNRTVVISLTRGEQEEFVENPITVTTKIRTAFDARNALIAADIEVSANFGASCACADWFLDEALKKSLGIYSARLFSISAEARFSKSRPRAIDFSMLDAQLFFGIECHLNKVADLLGESPKTLRLKNISPRLPEREDAAEGIRKICGALDDCVRIKIEEFDENDLTKCERKLVSDFEFSPSVFDRKWSSFRLTNKKRGLLYRRSNLRGTGLSVCFRESGAGTAFAFCTMEAEVDPLTYKEEIVAVRLLVDGGRLLNQERAVSAVKAAVQRMVKIMADDSCAACANIAIRFLKSDGEAKKIGDLVHSALPAAFISAVSQALGRTVSDFPIGSRRIFDILGETP